MPETGTAIAAYFAGSAGVEAGTAAALDASMGMAGTAAAGGIGGTGATAGLIGAGGAITATGVMGAAAQAAAGGAAGALVTSALAPKGPVAPPSTPMPDQMAQEEARKRSIAEQMARRGRAASIMTAPATGGTLGG